MNSNSNLQQRNRRHQRITRRISTERRKSKRANKMMEEELRSTKERLEHVVTLNPAVIYSGKPFADLFDWS